MRLESFYEGTSDNDLKALELRIQKDISNSLQKNSIHPLSPYFGIISYESRALLFDSRVPMVPRILNFFTNGPDIMNWDPSNHGSKKIHPTALKKVDPSTFTVFWHYFLQILGIGHRFEGSFGSGTHEFLLAGTADNGLKALKVRIEKNISNTLNKNLIHR